MAAKTTIRTTKATIKAISTAIKTIISWTQALIATRRLDSDNYNNCYMPNCNAM